MAETGGSSVAGLVLAAGRSTRMGAPKPLLELDGRTFLATAVATLRAGGCDPVVVVSSREAAEAAREAGATAVEGRPDGEQIDSLRRGLDALGPDVEAAVVLPVDHPKVAPGTVRALLEARSSSPDSVVRPVYRGGPGHPTVFPRRVWAELWRVDLPEGARSVVEAGPVVDVPVDDPGVVADIDTPDAYRRHAGSDG